MKSGTQSPNKPVMSARPPQRSSASMLDDLAKVADITEAPSRAAAQVLGGAGEGAAPIAEAEVAPVETPAAPVAAPKPKLTAKGRAPMPWDDLADSKVTQQVNFKLPVPLLTKLKFLGETTYGETMTSIVKRVLEAEVARMLKDRGLS